MLIHCRHHPQLPVRSHKPQLYIRADAQSHKRCEHSQNHPRAQTSARRGGCPTKRGCGRHTKPWRSICILSFSWCAVKMITLACLNIQGRDACSIMFISSVSDKINLIPKSTVPYKPWRIPQTKQGRAITFCNACNAASVKYLIQMGKKN